MKLNLRRIHTMALAALILALSAVATAQYTETVLYNFGGVTHDPLNPTTGLIFDSAGNLYGTSGVGGTGFGNVYELSPSSSGWTETTLYSFTNGTGDATEPSSALIFDGAGNLYGVSQAGGSKGLGTVFELSPSSGGWTEKVLYSFQGGADGQSPSGGLAFDKNGNLYGTTFEGGGGTASECFVGCGTVFELTPSGGTWTEKIIYAFAGGADGAAPGGNLLVDKLGSLYGAASAGGSTNCSNGCGTVFRLIPSAGSWHFGVLFSFQGKVGGAVPVSLAFDSANNIIGAAQNGGGLCTGGLGCGLVFKLTRPTGSGNWKESVLHPFTGKHDGELPDAVTIDANGNIFGTCFFGPYNHSGTVWELSPSSTGWTFSVLAGFINTTSTGAQPDSGVIVDSQGNLFGTAAGGGTFDHGVVFELSPSANSK